MIQLIRKINMKFLASTILLLLASQPVMAKLPPLYERQDCTKLSTQIDMNQCACANRDSADKTLNDTYTRVKALMPNQAAMTKLKNDERNWIKMRDETCQKRVGKREDSGSIWEMDMCGCHEDMTAERIKALNKMYPATIDQLD
jgi:uncharacterized protein YecT (DUF1311 family)